MVSVRVRAWVSVWCRLTSVSGSGLVITVRVAPLLGHEPIPSGSQDKPWAEGCRPYTRSHLASLKLRCEHALTTRHLTPHQPDPAWGISTQDGMARTSLHTDTQTHRGSRSPPPHTHIQGGDLGLHKWIRDVGLSDSEPPGVTF